MLCHNRHSNFSILTYFVLQVKEESTSLPLFYLFTLFFPTASGRGWTQTLDPGMTRKVFYHCATAAGQSSHSKVVTVSLVPAILANISMA